MAGLLKYKDMIHVSDLNGYSTTTLLASSVSSKTNKKLVVGITCNMDGIVAEYVVINRGKEVLRTTWLRDAINRYNLI